MEGESKMIEGSVARWMGRAWQTGLMALAAVLVMSGCTDMQALGEFRADAQALRQSLNARADQWDETLGKMPADDPARTRAEAEAAQTRAAVATVDAGIARIDEVLEEAAKPTDPLTETVGAASRLLPMPLRGPLVLGAAAAVVGLRAWRLKTGLASVARGLSVALREDEEFRTCFGKHANTFRATQTPTAKRVIDEVTHTGPMVRLPV